MAEIIPTFTYRTLLPQKRNTQLQKISSWQKRKPPVETGGIGWQYEIQENDGWNFLSKHREMTAHSTEAWESPKPDEKEMGNFAPVIPEESSPFMLCYLPLIMR